MNNEKISATIETIRTCFQTRDFQPLVNLFADDGVYETPYAGEASKAVGIDAIRARFAMVSASPWNKAVKITAVTVRSTIALDGNAVYVAFNITGNRVADNAPFDFPSSVAIIHFHNEQIARYEDYPNVAGIRKAAGLE